MAIYAIGDLQGCFAPLEKLLAEVSFDGSRDRLWFVGDLVNRGPQSLACLRFVKSLGASAVTVLGNHDLHLLCVAAGVERARSRDTLDEVLGAPDRDELLNWLRHRPLMHVEGPYALVHAGLLPSWEVPRARALAGEVEAVLQGPSYRRFLGELYGDEPDCWEDSLAGADRLRVIVNAMTRLRVCDRDGAMVLSFKGEPGETRGACIPWFEMAGRASAAYTVICGHWSALGLRVSERIVSLDTGCVWGRSLTAVRLSDRRVYQVRCRASAGRED
jgi:bis(5'-nucleosyl)-tetraphosphatase (symmetrical)